VATLRKKFRPPPGNGGTTASERPSKIDLDVLILSRAYLGIFFLFLLVFLGLSFLHLVLIAVLALVGARLSHFIGYGDFVRFRRERIFGVLTY